MTPLHQLGTALRELLAHVPLGFVRAAILLLLAALLVWVLTLPRSAVAQDGDSRPGSNLRIWAALAVLIQIVIYALF